METRATNNLLQFCICGNYVCDSLLMAGDDNVSKRIRVLRAWDCVLITKNALVAPQIAHKIG